jgi:hypothetical protein
MSSTKAGADAIYIHSAAKVERTRRGQALETRVHHDGDVIAQQATRHHRQARLGQVRLRQRAPGGHQQHHGEHHQEPEDRRPMAPAQDPSADHRRHRRRDAEDHRYLAHQALGVVAMQHVADHGATDDQADTGRQALQCAECKQRGEVLGQGATRRGDGEHHQAAENDPAPPDRIRQRAVHDAHRSVGDQVDADGLLHGHLVGAELRADRRERREDRVDRERPEHRQSAQQHGQRAHGDGQRGFGGGVIHRVGNPESLGTSFFRGSPGVGNPSLRDHQVGFPPPRE